jgi:catechol 2,3-dioxygenase-like lactoylglutathione lyase family enzyme
LAPPASQIEILGFDHVDLKVRNREKARRFFVEQLGLDPIGEAPDHTFLLFGDQVLGLRDAKPDEPLGGVDHIALRVAEWTGLRNRVRRARIVVVREKERDDSRSLFLRGPDGLTIELVYRPDPDHHARHDTTPVTPPPEDAEIDESAPAVRPPRRRRASR